MQKKTLIILLGITLLGAILRIANLSPFNVYPDSYQNLIVAKNIVDYHSMLGYLGPSGMLYPDFFSWSHPVYPVLIILVTAVTHNMTTSARGIALIAGILAIPLAYLFIKRVFSSSVYGLAGALFLALSFNHTVWSGFLMTETTGVFFMILFLISIFVKNKNTNSLFQNVTSGILFTFAVMTRYEYIVLLVPVFFLMSLTYQNPAKQIITFIATFLIATAGIIILLFPLPSTFTVILLQLHNLILRALLIFFILGLLFGVIAFLSKEQKHLLIKFAKILAVLFVWFLFIFFNAYFIHEIFLSIFSLIGFSLMLTKDKTKSYSVFALLSCVFLLPIYYYINPAMERYVTHLIPFLLIPASYGVIEVLTIIRNKKLLVRMLVLIPLMILLIIQTILTFSGMRYSQDASWYRISYEDKSAMMVKKYISDTTNLIITSYPEPYYYTLNLSTQSISDTYPYIFINNLSNNKQIVIIDDMGMHTDFPTFSKFLTKHLSADKIAAFQVHEKFHYQAEVLNEKYPVVIYKLTLGELKQKIRKYQF